MALIFNSITQFVEQVGRRMAVKKADELDSLTCIFNGPTGTAPYNIPGIGTPHSGYKGMYVTEVSVTNMAAWVTEIQVTYLGKFASNGDLYFSLPDITTSWHETTVTNAGVEVRFIAKSVTFTYFTNMPYTETLNTLYSVQSLPYLGYLHLEVYNQGYLLKTTDLLTQNVVFTNDQIDFRQEPLSNNWRKFTEVFMTRAHLKLVDNRSSVAAAPPHA